MLAMRSESRPPLPPIKRQRHDGWTLKRQMLFLAELRRTRNVVRAAAAAEFAAAWDRTLRVVAPPARPE